jgi:RNA-directed DNA polymerase
VDNNVFHSTESGTPQGGIISPLLANIALHGMEAELGVTYKMCISNNNVEHRISSSLSIVRYADDCAPRMHGA